VDSIVAVQAAQPLHWIIDLVPVALALTLTAMQKGGKPSPGPKVNAHVEERATERVAKLTRTLEELKAALADQKTIEKQLRESEEHYRNECVTVQSELDMLRRTSTHVSAMPATSAVQQSESATESFARDERDGRDERDAPQDRQYYDADDEDVEQDTLPTKSASRQEASAQTQFSVSKSGLLRVPGLSPDDEAPQAISQETVAPTAAPAAQSPAQPFDLSEALARVDGDHELLREMAELFLEESPRFVSEMQTALKNNDTQTLTYAAHTLKGSVGNFAAPEAADAARQLEQMGRKRELEGAGVILAQLEAALGRLQPALESLNTLEAEAA
jgi:HPt (histidine-containing phosphotransfer) domain-containing protein